VEGAACKEFWATLRRGEYKAGEFKAEAASIGG
jgi:hypothetical protein